MSDSLAPSRPLTLTGSLGSTFRQVRAPPDAVPEMAAEFDWNRLGRRVVIDPVAGLIAWMSPSSAHEGYARAADKVAEGAGERLGLLVKALGGTRWRLRPDDPDNTGVEPDACFYVGASAEGWQAAFESGGQAAAEAIEAETPPDLVVEIEWTQIDRESGKAQRYAELGVREMWRAEKSSDRDSVTIQILDLQADGGLAPAKNGSPLFEGLDADRVERLLALAYRTRLREMEGLLEELLSPPVEARSSPARGT